MSVHSSEPPADLTYDIPPEPHVRRSLPVALIAAMRPKQITKNLFVYAAPVFAGRLFDPVPFWQATAAFVLFCIVSGCVYLLNDMLDVKQDREHPKKRHRPIASGDLPVPVAMVTMVLLVITSLVAAFMLRQRFGILLSAYFGLQVTYCFYLKHIVLLDVFSIALGFVLRTVAGGIAASIYISRWLLLCSLLLALLLGFGKRRQELVLQGSNAGKSRQILNEYGLPFLDQIINIVAGISIVCYSVYCLEAPASAGHPHIWVTIPIVIYSVCRYLYLVYQKGMGGAPDEVLLKDRALQIAIVLWLVLALLVIAFDRPNLSLWG